MADTAHRVALRSEPEGPLLHGCSLLFDNPDQYFSPVGDLLYMDTGAETDSPLALYTILHDAIAPKESDPPINRDLRRAKPSSFYHVTVWGGINDNNVAGVVEPHRAQLRDWLARLPDSLPEHRLHTSTILSARLVQRTDWNVRFRLDKIVNWHNACLAAVLRPFDADAERVLSEIVQNRAALSAEFGSIFGIKPPDTFTPHITLRAFADPEAARRAEPYIPALSETAQQRAGHMTLTFDSISLYGFTQVTRVFKVKTTL